MLYWLLYEKLFPFFHPFRIFRYLTFRTAFRLAHGAADRALHRPVGHPQAARVPDRPVCARGRAAVAPEEDGHAHDGRRADLHCDSAAHGAVVRSGESVCVDRGFLYARLSAPSDLPTTTSRWCSGAAWGSRRAPSCSGRGWSGSWLRLRWWFCSSSSCFQRS